MLIGEMEQKTNIRFEIVENFETCNIVRLFTIVRMFFSQDGCLI